MTQLNLSEINLIHDYPADQFYHEMFDKTQIYLHHTASGRGVKGDLKHWIKSPAKIATCVLLDYEGVLHQCFSSAYWAHHLGIKGHVFAQYGLRNDNVRLNKHSIGIEVDSWGPLVKKNRYYYSWCGTRVPVERVHIYEEPFKVYPGTPFFQQAGVMGRDCFYYEKYTDEQIEKLRQLLVYFNEKYAIPLDYNEDIWDVTTRALKLEPGIYTHNSVRVDKSDVHPQPELIEMLKTLAV